jgi:beta-glucosidase
MAEMGIEVYRFGVEWSRIEPIPGKFDESVLAHYREEIEYMISKGIRPMLTLHHFTNPIWFESIGGFTNKRSPDIFLAFASKVIDALGDLVDDYITVNEPNVYATNSLFYGMWPPEKRSIIALIKAYSNFTAAHIRTYRMIHDKRLNMGKAPEETLVGFANHLRVFEPQDETKFLHRLSAKVTEYLFQGALTDAMMTGKCLLPVLKRPGVRRGKYYDFIGINYYSRSTVSGIKDGVNEWSFKNDLGWEIYHEGLIELSNKLYEKYEAPVFVTENGTCDNNDSFRPLFIYDQLKAISEESNPITRYYHWSIVDNFEWREGESARFGLVHVDYETGERSVKDSGKLYADIIKNRGVTDEAYADYVSGRAYHM